jgi:hypothetical protein
VILSNNLRGGHSFGSSRKRRNTSRKITTFKLGEAVLTALYDGAFSPTVDVTMHNGTEYLKSWTKIDFMISSN